MKASSNPALRDALDALYMRRNRREFVDPDPLQCVYRYSDPRDIEIAALIAAGLAYGRVVQIMRNVSAVFDTMGPSPRRWLERKSNQDLLRAFERFQHRWTTRDELVALLSGVRDVLAEHETLEAAFTRHQTRSGELTPALAAFCNELRGAQQNSLLPDPAKNGACKRLHLYLRWMVRSDEVDLGCWSHVDPAILIVPLDTHMHQIARRLGMTKRNPANLATALEVTRAFQQINPADPIKYDFVLTRFGIRSELSLPQLDEELALL